MSLKIRIREATEKGYIDVLPGMVFDASFPTSRTRRGRVQGGGEICPTLMSGESEIYFYECCIETDSDRESPKPEIRDKLRWECVEQERNRKLPNDNGGGNREPMIIEYGEDDRGRPSG